MTSVSAFLYRLPRFDVMFPIEFLLESALQEATPTSGRCLNLSNTGLLGSFAYPLGQGSSGIVRLKPASRSFSLRATVTHSEGMHSGLRLDFANDQERQVVRALVEAIASRSGLTT